MFGSWLALLTRQSMLQARILNITAASAAVGGFFGFPMAGGKSLSFIKVNDLSEQFTQLPSCSSFLKKALFVLEL
jgi:hypothetical protein